MPKLRHISVSVSIKTKNNWLQCYIYAKDADEEVDSKSQRSDRKSVPNDE